MNSDERARHSTIANRIHYESVKSGIARAVGVDRASDEGGTGRCSSGSRRVSGNIEGGGNLATRYCGVGNVTRIDGVSRTSNAAACGHGSVCSTGAVHAGSASRKSLNYAAVGICCLIISRVDGASGESSIGCGVYWTGDG